MSKTFKKPELLAPAGSLKTMRHAYAFGADAVYAGLPRYSLRVRNNDFKKDNLQIGIEEAHAQNKKFYVAVNLLPHNYKLSTFFIDMEPVAQMKPDAFIMADPGLIMMVKEKWPEIPVHLSVQMNTVNYMAVKFWQKQGIERIILSRELSLDEIAEIRQLCPDIELEVFVHGALCIAYSGRCLLSGYFNHRDPNQGACTNACRWEYKTTAANETPEGKYTPAPEAVLPAGALDISASLSACGSVERHPLADKVYFLEEKNRPGELMPVIEDEHGTYIMNSKDLRAIEHVQRLTEMGIDCLKIEGRTKSHYYAARTAQAYRKAIDLAAAGEAFDPTLIGVLENLSNRGYTDGFYQRHHSQDHQNYISGASRTHRQEFVGEALSYDAAHKMLVVDVKNRFAVGDKIEFVVPSGRNIIAVIARMEDKNGQPIDVAAGNGHIVRIPYEGEETAMVLVARFLPEEAGASQAKSACSA